MGMGECGEKHWVGKKDGNEMLEDFSCQTRKGVGGFAL